VAVIFCKCVIDINLAPMPIPIEEMESLLFRREKLSFAG